MAVEIIDGGSATSTFSGVLDGGNAFTVFPPAPPTVVAKPNGAPVPSVQITLSDVAPGTQVVNLYRIADGRQFPVRGGIRKFAVGGASVVDWEAPFGVPITYRAEFFADAEATISLGFSDPVVVQLDVARAWIHQPLNPGLSVSPEMLWGTALERTRETPGELVYVQGAETATWVGGRRRGAQDVPFALLVDRDGADAFQALLGGYTQQQSAVLCIRTPSAMRVPRTFFATVSSVKETTLNRPGGGEAIQVDFTATETRPPAPGLVAALLRRMDVDAAYPTRAARASAYLTRLERDSDYSLVGAAGDA
jgi:hypothetical protein